MSRTSDAVTDLLRRARARIADPQRWTHGTTARDGWGRATGPASVDAVAWCAVGSLRAEEVGLPAYEAAGLRGRGYRRLLAATGRPPEDVNDYLGHEAVLAMFDEAIRRK